MMNRTRFPARQGFSLIELLVVIAILGTLFAIAGFAIFRTSSTQQVKVAEQTLKNMQLVLHSQIKTETDKARDPGGVNDYLLSQAKGDPVRARILRAKLGMRVAFPQSFAEAKYAGVPSGPTYALCGVSLRNDMSKAVVGTTNGTGQDLYKEAAACLFIALSRGEGGNADNLAGTGKTKEITIGGKPFQVYLDVWGTPISFFRWSELPPAYVISDLDQPPLARTTGVRSIDPLDPEGFLFTNYSAPQVELLVGHKFATPHNWLPHLISAGPDKLYGTTDDIMSFQLK